MIVLIVDDSKENRESILKCLTKLGLDDVIHSNNGNEAWKHIESNDKISMIFSAWDPRYVRL